MTDIFRFFNTQTGVHFYTASTVERDSVIANLPHFSFEGEAFQVSSTDLTITPVHRFLKNDGTHFYTISDVERATLETSNPAYTYEGTAYRAARGQTETHDTPLYRFFNTQTGTHFYTASAAERDNVIATLPQFSFEGIGYYVSASTITEAPANFDESWYLLAYPDIEDAIVAGTIASASAHYLAFGRSEGRLAFDDPDLFSFNTRSNGTVLNGGRGDDNLNSGSQRNVSYQIFGETGNDTLRSAGPADNLNGGSGDDTYHVSGPDVVVVEGLNGGTDDTVFYYGFLPSELPANVEHFNVFLRLEGGESLSTPFEFDILSVSGDGTFNGSDRSEEITATGAAFPNGPPGFLTVDGGGGDDQINASGILSVTGGAGNDTIIFSGGGTGSILSGGTGTDAFRYIPIAPIVGIPEDFGDTTITDFDGAGGETIDISRNAGTILTVSDAIGGAVVTISGTTDLSTQRSSGTFTLTGVSAANVDDGWFI